jgi:hypothetical protein
MRAARNKALAQRIAQLSERIRGIRAQAEERTVIAYLLRPLLDAMRRARKEA